MFMVCMCLLAYVYYMICLLAGRFAAKSLNLTPILCSILLNSSSTWKESPEELDRTLAKWDLSTNLIHAWNNASHKVMGASPQP